MKACVFQKWSALSTQESEADPYVVSLIAEGVQWGLLGGLSGL